MRILLELTSDGFLGGASQAPELRVPSIRGLLRFWWRALHSQLSPEQLRERESALFGDTSRSGAPLRVLRSNAQRNQASVDRALGYVGFGPVNFRGEKTRGALAVGSWAELELVDAKWSPEQRQEVAEAFWVLGALGGCGSRSRRGFGSLQVMGWSGPEPAATWPGRCQTPAELVGVWRTFLAPFRGRTMVPSWTALSGHTRVFVWRDTFATWSDALAAVAKDFRDYRTRLGKDHGPSLPGPDHDLIYEFARTGRASRAPRRAAFGLPHNYQLTSQGRYMGRSACRVDVNVAGAHGSEGRRASPIFFHVARLATARFVPVIGYVPGVFLPDGLQLTLACRPGQSGDATLRTARADVAAPTTEAIDTFFDGGTIPSNAGPPHLWSPLSGVAEEASP